MKGLIQIMNMKSEIDKKYNNGKINLDYAEMLYTNLLPMFYLKGVELTPINQFKLQTINNQIQDIIIKELLTDRQFKIKYVFKASDNIFPLINKFWDEDIINKEQFDYWQDIFIDGLTDLYFTAECEGNNDIKQSINVLLSMFINCKTEELSLYKMKKEKMSK